MYLSILKENRAEVILSDTLNMGKRVWDPVIKNLQVFCEAVYSEKNSDFYDYVVCQELIFALKNSSVSWFFFSVMQKQMEILQALQNSVSCLSWHISEHRACFSASLCSSGEWVFEWNSAFMWPKRYCHHLSFFHSV